MASSIYHIRSMIQALEGKKGANGDYSISVFELFRHFHKLLYNYTQYSTTMSATRGKVSSPSRDVG
jgi:hypothetical protein